MARLQPASTEQIDRIARESHALWGAGLSRAGYRALWNDLAATEWGRRHAEFLVWLDDRGELLSSMKSYRPRLSFAGREARCRIFGAIFTPPDRRRQGHARAMVESALAEAEAEAVSAVLLFSDIGTRYYAELGFRPIVAEEQWGRIPRSPQAGMRPLEFRDATAADGPAIRSAHDAFCRRQPIAILRDEQHWDYLDVRSKSFFSRLTAPGLEPRFRVALDRGRFAGYLLTVEGRGEWSVREVGAEGGDPVRMAEVLRGGAVEALAVGLNRVYGWLPPCVCAELGDWRLRRRARRRAIPMLRLLGAHGGAIDDGTFERAYLPFQDQF